MTHAQNWLDTPFSLAEDFYLVGLDARTNRPRLHKRAMGLGVSGALLAELVLAGHVSFDDDRVVVDPARSDVAIEHAQLLDRMVAEPPHHLSSWLRYLAGRSVEAVHLRLLSRRFAYVGSHGRLRLKSTYVPVDPMAVEWRTLRLARVIADRDISTWEDLALTGLVVATGLTDVVTWEAAETNQENLAAILRHLGAAPSLRSLLTEVETQIAAAVLALRT